MIDDSKIRTTASHVPILLNIALRTTGPILEFGCGFYSTLLLHEVACACNRQLLTTENNRDWLSRFLYLQNKLHTFKFIENWRNFKEPLKQNWGLIFIDHHPPLRRKEDIIRLRDNAEYIIVHDSDRPLYQYEKAFHAFKYQYDYTLLDPHTTVLSNGNNLEFLEKHYENRS